MSLREPVDDRETVRQSLYIGVDVSTVTPSLHLRTSEIYLRELYRELALNYHDCIPRVTVLTFASSVDVVTHNEDVLLGSRCLTRIGDSRAFGSLLRHLTAAMVADNAPSGSNVLLILAGTPTDGTAADAAELLALRDEGLVREIVGLNFGNDETRAILRSAGADVVDIEGWSKAYAVLPTLAKRLCRDGTAGWG
jgi:hypothetical protein